MATLSKPILTFVGAVDSRTDKALEGNTHIQDLINQHAEHLKTLKYNKKGKLIKQRKKKQP